MKKNIYILIALLLVFTACENFVDVEPTHQEEIGNGLVDLDDYEGVMVGVHSAMRDNAYYGRNYGVLMDMMAEDLFESPESLGNRGILTNWLYAPDNVTISGAWQRMYQVILRANTVLSGIDDESIVEDVAGRKNRIKAQALGLRAMAHFDLLRAFGASYDRNSSELGVPVILTLDITQPERNTVQEVYDQIFSDLTEAMSLFDNGDLAQADIRRTFFSKLAAQALWARVALYAGLDTEAIDMATDVIDDATTGFTSDTVFPTLWTNNKADGTNAGPEVIFEIAFTPGTDSRLGGDIYFVPNNRVAFRPSTLWLGLFGTPADDVRYRSYVREDSRRGNAIIPSKYEANDGFQSHKAFRLSEMYLIRAEAYANRNMSTEASADLNTLRAARIAGYVNENLAGNALTNAIRIERRKELFLEGHRWFDIRRYGEGITRGPDFAAPATGQALSSGNFRFAWPIPQDEIDANPSIASQQNSGY